MNNEELIKEINILKGELEKTKNELVETKEHLKKYTAPSRSKTYYENHKDEIIKRVKEHKQKTNYTYEVSPEKRKQYNKIAYQKRKEKIDINPKQFKISKYYDITTTKEVKQFGFTFDKREIDFKNII